MNSKISIPSEPGEKFKQVKDIPGYYVSNKGRIYSTKSGAFIKHIIKYGYHKVRLRKDGRRIEKLVHKLMFESFGTEVRKGQSVTFKDNCRDNLSMDNMMLVDSYFLRKKRSRDDSRAFAIVENIGRGSLKVYPSVRAFAKEKGECYQTVSDYLNGKYPGSHIKKYSIKYLKDCSQSLQGRCDEVIKRMKMYQM